MNIVRYVCWRFSPAGRACYRSYALTADPQRTLTAAPASRARGQAAGYASGSQRGIRRRSR